MWPGLSGSTDIFSCPAYDLPKALQRANCSSQACSKSLLWLPHRILRGFCLLTDLFLARFQGASLPWFSQNLRHRRQLTSGASNWGPQCLGLLGFGASLFWVLSHRSYGTLTSPVIVTAQFWEHLLAARCPPLPALQPSLLVLDFGPPSPWLSTTGLTISQFSGFMNQEEPSLGQSLEVLYVCMCVCTSVCTYDFIVVKYT